VLAGGKAIAASCVAQGQAKHAPGLRGGFVGRFGGARLDDFLRTIGADPRARFVLKLTPVVVLNAFAIPKLQMPLLKAGLGFSDWTSAKLFRSGRDKWSLAVTGAGDDYYESLDMATAMHPQTLLCYEMYDQPLTRKHGAPLRLQIPTKIGYKQAKYLTHLKVTHVLERVGYWEDPGYTRRFTVCNWEDDDYGIALDCSPRCEDGGSHRGGLRASVYRAPLPLG
jgi:DMSO/TMAO reductase YedYZ molybdopterin-dependent catalytic subunit